MLGDPQAPVELVMFADLQCPVCAEVTEHAVDRVIESQVAAGTAKLSFRNFVIIPESEDAAFAAVAAGKQGNGWAYVENFFRAQEVENSGYVTDDFLTRIAEQAGVSDIHQWDEDRKSPEVISEVEATTDEASQLGAVGAPFFMIEGPGTEGLEEIPSVSRPSQLQQAVKAAR